MSLLDRVPTAPGATTDVHAPSSNTNAVVTLAAQAKGQNCIGQVTWSYGGAPTNGNLIIQDGGNTIFNIDITAAGPGTLVFFPAKRNSAVNATLVATLAAGGSGVSGKLSVTAWVESQT